MDENTKQYTIAIFETIIQSMKHAELSFITVEELERLKLKVINKI
jgi:hypothetical protein